MMREYYTDERELYEDLYHGQFSHRLARWAVGNMRMADGQSVPMRSVDDVVETLHSNGVDVPEDKVYTAWYVFMMSVADYPSTLPTDALRCSFVGETINDPDGHPCDALDCFVAKMRNSGKAILWERFL